MPNSKDPRTAKAELSEYPQSPVQNVVAWRSIWWVIGAILITLSLLRAFAVEGLGAALILLGYVLLYQLVENSWLSPKLSSETMSLSGGMAFGAALAGGSIAGPMGAFLALPTAALITSFITNYATTYEVAYKSQPDSPNDQDDDKVSQ